MLLGISLPEWSYLPPAMNAALEARVKKHGMEMLDKHRKEWEQFRDLVQSKIVEFWEDSKDIKIAIG